MAPIASRIDDIHRYFAGRAHGTVDARPAGPAVEGASATLTHVDSEH
jgi:hypothetical protein